jgi:type IV secretion system protein VirD4
MTNVGSPGPQKLLLGRLDRPGRDGLIGGSAPANSTSDGDGYVTFDGPSHLLTIAPNRSGRDRSCLIPNLLTYSGPMVVVDLNGEAYAATAEARRAMGHAVVRLDPFEVSGPGSDSLDPIDLLAGLEESALESACQDIANLILLRSASGSVTDYEAFGLLSGLIGYLAAVQEKRSFDQMYPTLHSDDIIYSLAVVLDTVGKILPKAAYSEIAAFLSREDWPRARILARLRSHFTTFGIDVVQKTLKGSTVRLSEIFTGAPVTVYIVMPAERLALHATLLRLWIGTLLLVALRSPERSSSPPALFLLDHCAELGPLPLLEALLKIESGGDLRIWTFWHDVHQLRTTYPGAWPEIVSGCGVVQVFGTKDSAAAAEAEALLGLPPNDVWSLRPGEQIVHLDGEPRRVRKLDS